MVACTTQGQEAEAQPSDSGPNREALIEALRAQHRLVYVYGTGDTTAADAYRKLLAEVASQSRRTQAIIRSDKEVTETELKEMPVFLLGTPDNNAVLKRLLPRLPFNVTAHTVEFNQHQYGDHPVLSIGFFPNPLAPNLPISLMTGLDDQSILTNIRGRFTGKFYWFAFSGWGYELFDGGRRKVMGFFDESDPKQWRIGGKTHWDFSEDGPKSCSFGQCDFYNHQSKFPPSMADSIQSTIAAAHQRIADLLGKEAPQDRTEIHLYPSIELKGLATGDTRPVSLGEDGERLHMVIHPEFEGREWPEVNLPLIHRLAGPCKIPALEWGLAVWGTSHWERDGWQAWAQRLTKGGNVLTIREMLDGDIWQHESPYLKACFAAALVAFFIEKQGKENFRTLWGTSEEKAQRDWIPLEKEFAAYLSALPPVKAALPHAPLPSYHRAFNFAHEGYQIFNGYASKEATLAMDYLQHDMYCNMTAVIPYAGYADVHSPGWLEFSNGAGAESDESIIHCIWSARQAGMGAMIKPQVWPWNSWTGEIAMQNDADWDRFFDHYYRWIRHYAVMAEMYDAPILCMGVEFSKATLERPDDWRKMVQRLRGIYSGKITYAANWGEEFEQCRFWDALDYIGINCYYPLSKQDKPSQKALNQGFAEILEKVERVAANAKKDVLFTEIGFRSVERAWQNPHAEPDGRKSDFEAQAACYRAMIDGLTGKEWCKGVYLWKWPAYMDDAQYDLQGFTPLGRPSEGMVKEWFGKP